MSFAPQPVQTSGINDIYEYQEVHLDSGKRDSGDNNHPYFVLHPVIQKVLAVKVTSAEIPLTHYNVNTTNNTFVMGAATIVLPTGNYTVTGFKTALAAETGNSSWTYVTQTGKWTVTTGSSLVMTDRSPLLMLGFDIGTYPPSGGIITAPNVAIFSGPTCFYLTSNSLSTIVSSHIRTNGSTTPNPPTLAKIPITVNPFTILQFRDVNPGNCFDVPNTTVSDLDMQLLDGHTLKPVDLNGAGWSVTLQFLCQRDTPVPRIVYPPNGHEGAKQARTKRIRT